MLFKDITPRDTWKFKKIINKPIDCSPTSAWCLVSSSCLRNGNPSLPRNITVSAIGFMASPLLRATFFGRRFVHLQQFAYQT